MARSGRAHASRRRLLASSAGLATALASFAAVAGETDQGAELSLVRGEGAGSCVTTEIVKGEVTARLGRNPFTQPVRQHIECLVKRANDRFIVNLYERDPHGQLIGDRELSVATTDCRELDDALVLAVTLLIDPEYLVRKSEISPNRPPEPRRSEAEAATAARTVHREPASHADLSSTVALLGPTGLVRLSSDSSVGDTRATLTIGLSQGLLPGPGPDLALSVQRRIAGLWHARVTTLYSPERQLAGVTPTTKFGLTALKLAGCVETTARIAPTACGGFAVGAIHSVVYEQRPVHPGDRGWAAVSLDGGARAVIGPMTLEVQGHLWAPLVRWKFNLLSGGKMYREDVVARGLSIGVGMHFP